MTRQELAKAHTGIYQWLLRKNQALLDKYFPRERRKMVEWTLKSIKAEALKYKTIGEWSKSSSASYKAARVLKLVDECSKHMPPSKTRKKYIKNVTTGKVFKTSYLAAEEYNFNRGSLYRAMCNNTKVRGHYYAYCDENGNILK